MAGKKTKIREHNNQGTLGAAQTRLWPPGPVFPTPSGVKRPGCEGGNDQAMTLETPEEGAARPHRQKPPSWTLVLLLQLLDQGAEPADLPGGQGIKLFLLLQDVPIQPLQLC